MFDHETLRSALDGLAETGLAEMANESLERHLVEVERACRILEAERLRAVAELDRRAASFEDGHLSTAAWMANRLGASFRAAAAQVHMARALEQMPLARESLRAGELSSSAVRVLVAAKEEQPQAFGHSEDLLVQAARALPVGKLQQAVSEWSRKVDARAVEDRARRLRERRSLRISEEISGMVHLEGELDPEGGQTVISGLRAVMDGWARSGAEDARSPDQRRADALVEIIGRDLDRRDRPLVAGERPHLMVKVDLETLRGGAGVAQLEDAGPLSRQALERLACDCSVTRVVMAGGSQPLDVGRKTPKVPLAIRRALVLRDGTCTFPGCDRPPSWCDPHHVKHWTRGGPTSLANLLLVCRPHHELLHEGGFEVRMERDGPVFVRPDGSMMQRRGPELGLVTSADRGPP